MKGSGRIIGSRRIIGSGRILGQGRQGGWIQKPLIISRDGGAMWACRRTSTLPGSHLSHGITRRPAGAGGASNRANCRNLSQMDQHWLTWLMILIRCMGLPSISSQDQDIIYVSTRRRPPVNACQYHLKLLLLGPSYFLPARLSFTYDCPNFVAS